MMNKWRVGQTSERISPMPDYEDRPVRPSIPRSRGPRIAAVLGTICLLLVVIVKKRPSLV